MDLKQFVKNAIVNIDNSLEEASNETGKIYLFTNGTTEDGKGNIHFNLTVYAESEEGLDSKGGIKVCGLGGFSFSGFFKRKNYTTSKIEFSICRKSK